MHHRVELLAVRAETEGRVKELSERLKPISRRLRALQPPSVAKVVHQIDIALIAVLIFIVGWSDWKLAWRFVSGFFAAGWQEVTGLFPELDAREPDSSREALLEANARVRQQMLSDPVSAEVEFLWDSVVAE